VVTVLRPGLIPQNPRGDGELAMAGQGTEVEGTIAVRTNRRQGHAEDTLLAPLEVNSSHIEVTPQGIWEEVRVGRESPRLVQLPGVGNQTIAQLIGEIGIGIIAILANIHGNIGDEGIRIGVHGGQFVPPNPRIGGQVENIHGIGTGIGGGVANAHGSGVQDPQTTALVHLDAIGGGDTIGTISGRIRTPVRIGNQLRRTRQTAIHIDISQSGWNS